MPATTKATIIYSTENGRTYLEENSRVGLNNLLNTDKILCYEKFQTRIYINQTARATTEVLHNLYNN
jgi:hypothetical protein